MSQGIPKTKTQEVTEGNTMLQDVPIDKNTMLQSKYKHLTQCFSQHRKFEH